LSIFGLTIGFANPVLADTIVSPPVVESVVPLITSVDPMDGAPSNWITILGKNFGSKIGLVEFATDFNNNTRYDADEWVKATIVSCNNTPSWSTNSIVVQVPQKGKNIFNNTAAQFNGTNAHIEIATDATQITNAFTFEAWVKPVDSGAHKTILSKVDPVAKQGYFLALNNLQPAVWLSGLTNPGWHSVTNKIPLNVWSHIVVTFNGSSIRFYINSTLIRSISLSGSLVPLPGKKLWIGMREDFTTINQFRGALDEVALYNKVLTATQISDHYTEAQKVGGGNYSTLVNQSAPLGYWRLGEGSGIIASDSSAKLANGNYVGDVTLRQLGIFGSDIKEPGIGEKSAIRITVSSTLPGTVIDLFDSTVDELGSKPNGDGLFVLNTTERPSVCPVIIISPPPPVEDPPSAKIPGLVNLFFMDIGQRLQLLFTIDPVKDAEKRLEFANSNLELAKIIISATEDPNIQSRANNLIARANTLVTTVNDDAEKWSKGEAVAINNLLENSRLYIETSKELIGSIKDIVSVEQKSGLDDLFIQVAKQTDILAAFIQEKYPAASIQPVITTTFVRPPVIKDQDRDGIDDDQETDFGIESTNFDTDGDGLSDRAEIERYGTDPTKDDTDSDGFRDGLEVLKGFNPNGSGFLPATKPAEAKLKFLNDVKVKTNLSPATLQYINFTLQNYKIQ